MNFSQKEAYHKEVRMLALPKTINQQENYILFQWLFQELCNEEFQ